jgi:hypothetical protein
MIELTLTDREAEMCFYALGGWHAMDHLEDARAQKALVMTQFRWKAMQLQCGEIHAVLDQLEGRPTMMRATDVRRN